MKAEQELHLTKMKLMKATCVARYAPPRPSSLDRACAPRPRASHLLATCDPGWRRLRFVARGVCAFGTLSGTCTLPRRQRRKTTFVE